MQLQCPPNTEKLLLHLFGNMETAINVVDFLANGQVNRKGPKEPCAVVITGPPCSGKTTFAWFMAMLLGDDAVRVKSIDSIADWERFHRAERQLAIIDDTRYTIDSLIKELPQKALICDIQFQKPWIALSPQRYLILGQQVDMRLHPFTAYFFVSKSLRADSIKGLLADEIEQFRAFLHQLTNNQ